MSARTSRGTPAGWRDDADEVPLAGDHQPDAVLLSRMLFDPSHAGRQIVDAVIPSEFPRAWSRRMYGAFIAAIGAHADGVTTTAVMGHVREHAPAVFSEIERAAAVPFDAWEDSDGAELAVADQVRTFRAWSRRVRLWRVMQYVQERATDDALTVDQVERLLEQRLEAYRAGTRDDRVYDDAAQQTAEAKAWRFADPDAGLRFGFAALDGPVMPPQAGQLIVVAGTQSSGKSTVARNWVRRWLMRGVPCAVLSVEMSGAEWRTALACQSAELSQEGYAKQRYSGREWAEFDAAVDAYAAIPHFVLNERAALTPADVLRLFRRYRAQFAERYPDRLCVMVLDHFHRIDFGSDVRFPTQQRDAMNGFARQLKNFAKEEACVVLVMAQYRKLAPKEVPDDSMIRDASGLSDEADKMFHVWRPLVAHERDVHGALWPLTGADGGPVLESDAPEDSVLQMDPRHVYIILGKQRVRLHTGIVQIPFRLGTGRMYDGGETPEERATHGPERAPDIFPGHDQPDDDERGAA